MLLPNRRGNRYYPGSEPTMRTRDYPMIDFECRIRRSSRRKSLSICVYPDNSVVVAAPDRVSRSEIMRFVASKADWVHKRMDINREKQASVVPHRFVTGERLLCRGHEHVLEVEEGKTSGVALRGDDIIVRVRTDTPAELRGQMVKRQLSLWYSRLALQKIEERVRHYSAVIGVIPGSVRIKSLRSRWGSCSIRGGINFAWNIIMAPDPILDYLVVHELCHLVHHDHSAVYWQLVAAFIPDYRERRKWLRENGRKLTL